MNPKYPVYIISKGRAESRLTVKTLEKMRVPYKIVIEPVDYDKYASVINPSNILTLPFSNLGQGSIPARNWVWEHSLSAGDKRHWILDDNINGFFRLNRNIKPKVGSGTVFRVIEDFTDRYENIAMSGFNYFYLCVQTAEIPPFYLNTRIYSTILINNSLSYRWRGRYNEDTDLSLRALKDGWCTVLFNAFLSGKVPTLQMSGGNTDTIYNSGDKRLEFTKSLCRQHPDCVKITFKYGRWHHSVDYSKFKKNKLIRKKTCYDFIDKINNYGMELYDLKTGKKSDYEYKIG